MNQLSYCAVVFMDVVGYTRLMARDQEGTVERFNRIKDELVVPLANRTDGKIVRLLGDSIMVQFENPSQAVDFSIAVQKEIADSPLRGDGEDCMIFRVGSNWGEAIFDDQGPVGTSVNIAARLQDLAPTGGICITDRMFDEIGDEFSHDFEFAGNQYLKNLEHPVGVWNWKHASGSSLHLVSKPTDAHRRPGVAILPFHYIARDDETKYLADGLAEDLITRLNYSPVLRVIGRNSSFVYRERPRDLQKLAEVLKVNYFIEGSIRPSGDRIKVNVQLSNGEGQEQVWSQAYNEPLDEIHDIMDQIVEKIVRSIDPAITREELRRAARKKPQSMGAWDHLLQGKAALNKYQREQNILAKGHFTASADLEPDFAYTHAMLARCHFADAYLGWTEDRNEAFQTAFKLSSHAIELDENEAQGHVELVSSGLVTRHFDRAYDAACRAVDLNSYSSDSHFSRGLAELYCGDLDKAKQYLNSARTFNPADPTIFLINTALGLAHYCSGDFKNALRMGMLAEEAPHGRVSASMLKAISFSKMGEEERAKKAMANLTKLTFTQKTNLLSNMPFRDQSRLQQVIEGLEIAGW